MRWLLPLLVCLLLHQQSLSAEPIVPATQIGLLDKRGLTGLDTWLVDTKREDPRRVFSATNGMIRISGEGLGYLGTEKEYRDYHLVVEFKWGKTNWHWGDRVGKAGDSGIFLHATGPDGNSHDGRGAFMAAIECNLFQGATGDFLLIRGNAHDGSLIAPRLTTEVANARDGDGSFTWQRGGRRQTVQRWGRVNWSGKDANWKDVLDFRGAHDVESPPDEWTRGECVCAGDRITIKVNGVTVNEAFQVYPTKGKILLQCEGSEIFFRRFELQPLNVPALPARRTN
ncbi:MAG: DUF1080 domain-containing protein [Verrucomicrobia bacterium]|nr:DUF1080 domain-containing protein [Verrucomicrobiota bacterium]